MDSNGCLEHLEVKMYERIEALLDEHRYDEASKIVELMQKVGIV